MKVTHLAHITAFDIRPSGRALTAYFSDGTMDVIHKTSRPGRFAAAMRFIGGCNWKRTQLAGSVLLNAPDRIKSLADSFADAAVMGVSLVPAESASNFESAAAESQRLAMKMSKSAPSFAAGHIRRAITYRWYARTLISGKIDRAALVKAYEGMDL